MSAIDALLSAPPTKRVALPAPADRARLRKAQKLTQTQVADALGVSISAVSAWEQKGRGTPRGRKREMYAELLRRIAERLGESTDWEGQDDQEEEGQDDDQETD